MFGSGMTTLIISNEEMNDIIKIVKSFEESSLLIKGDSETNQNEGKQRKSGFPSMLLAEVGTSSIRNLLTGNSTFRAGQDTIKAGQDFYCLLIL